MGRIPPHISEPDLVDVVLVLCKIFNFLLCLLAWIKKLPILVLSEMSEISQKCKCQRFLRSLWNKIFFFNTTASKRVKNLINGDILVYTHVCVLKCNTIVHICTK